MATTFLESATAATFGFEFWSSTSGTVASESTIVHTGPRSIKVSAYSNVGKVGVCGDNGRISCYLYVSAIPASTRDVFFITDSSQGRPFTIKLLATGKLQFYADQVASGTDGTTTLVAGTWYRVAIAYTITSASVNEFRVFLNGALEITASNVGSTNVPNTVTLSFVGLGPGE